MKIPILSIIMLMLSFILILSIVNEENSNIEINENNLTYLLFDNQS